MSKEPMIVMVAEDGSEAFAPWCDVVYPDAYRTGAVLTILDSDPARVVGDFRRLPDRVWQSRHGQEIRVFMTDPDCWQWTLDGMDVTDGTMHPDEAHAREQAHLCTDRPDGHYADFPLWDGSDDQDED